MQTLEYPEGCPKCQQRRLVRAEVSYRYAMVVFGLIWMFMSFAEHNHSFASVYFAFASHGWGIWINRFIGTGFVVSLLVYGYHELFDRVRTFTCQKCGHELSQPRRPLTFLQKTFFSVLCFGLFAFFVLLIVLVVITKKM